MMDLLHKDVIREMLDAHVAKCFDLNAAGKTVKASTNIKVV